MTVALSQTAATADRPGRPELRVVVRPAPRREPPFDDELTEAPVAGRRDPWLPFDRVPPVHAVPPAPVPRPEGLPDPARWTRRLLVGLVESADGRRPLGQLSSLLSPSIDRGLRTEFEQAAERRRPHWLHRAGVLTVRADEPAGGVAEACATLQVGDRVRAVALRLESVAGRWRCVRLQLG